MEEEAGFVWLCGRQGARSEYDEISHISAERERQSEVMTDAFSSIFNSSSSFVPSSTLCALYSSASLSTAFYFSF